VIGIGVKVTLQQELHWSEIDYSNINSGVPSWPNAAGRWWWDG